jgi:hypothetical protein
MGRRIRRRVGGAAAVALAALVLSACGGGGAQDLAQQACVHVNRSVSDYQRSLRTGTPPAVASRLRAQADRELRAALPIAAQATSADGSWNGLMTAISESSSVDEGHLIPSLRAQCVSADANQNVNPQGPGGGTKPANVNPKPASPG